ncbi:wax ester/triacylglycerol synthase domain-containing protein [Streptomyces sp. P1-3]|uniref:wax ester/triacylglycerol synthase domain-containing protein n=1 Tax=Streptomyces sp. P1-3 TaxID=3421658 RepID=UPI003D35B12B
MRMTRHQRSSATTVSHADFLTKTFLALGNAAPDPSDLYFGFQLRLSGPPPTLDVLRTHVGDRVEGLPALTHRLVSRGGRIRWERDPDFDIAHHVRSFPNTGVEASPAQAVLGSSPDETRPLWGLWLQTDGSEDWALCYLAHHAVQDATAMLHTLTSLFGDSGCELTRPTRQPPSPSEPRRSLLTLLPDVLDTYLPTSRPSPPPLPAAAQQERVLGHHAVELNLLREVARASGASINQVHLAALAAAWRNWRHGEGGAPSPWRPGRGPHALIPIDTRLPQDRERENGLGNSLGLMRVPLPCALPSSSQRLEATMASSSRHRVTRHRRALRTLTQNTPEWVAKWAMQRITDPRKSALTASNFRVRDSLSAFGMPIRDIVAIPWLPPGHTCFTFLVSYRDTARLSVLTPAGGPDPQRLASLWGEAVNEGLLVRASPETAG